MPGYIEIIGPGLSAETDLGMARQAVLGEVPWSPTATTSVSYVAANRGSRFERDARMIVWGLTKNESATFCSYMIGVMSEKYSGRLNCIEAMST